MIAVTPMLVTSPVRAGALDSLVITENSSTSLTAILNGTTSLTVIFNSADDWFIEDFRIQGTQPGGSGNAWIEPGPFAGLCNLVVASSDFPGLTVLSDRPIADASFGLPDGTADTTHFTFDGNPLSVTFFDKGDVATTVPDTGTTASLLAVSLAGMVFIRRKIAA